jgi:hypothetical protein
MTNTLLGRATILAAAASIAISGYAGVGWATMPQTQAVTVPAAVAPPTAAVAPPRAVVAAHTRICVRKKDYNKVRPGYTRDRVAGELHNRGRRISHRLIRDNRRIWRLVMVYRYPACYPGRAVIVRFRENPKRAVGGRVVVTSTSKQWIKW